MQVQDQGETDSGSIKSETETAPLIPKATPKYDQGCDLLWAWCRIGTCLGFYGVSNFRIGCSSDQKPARDK